MKIQVGQHWYTRGGATVEVVGKIDTGLMRYSKDWKPLGHAHLIRCRIVRRADGDEFVDEVCSYAVHDDGHYHADKDCALDLIGLAIEAAA